jgi:hypothetical protein
LAEGATLNSGLQVVSLWRTEARDDTAEGTQVVRPDVPLRPPRGLHILG